MTKVHRLEIEPMTEESFSPYGYVLSARDRPADHRIIAPVDFQADGRGTLGVIWQPYQGVKRRVGGPRHAPDGSTDVGWYQFQGLVFSQLERHFAVTQSFIQMSGSPAVVAVAEATDMDDPMASPDPEDVRAFLIDSSKGYVLKRGTWHSLNRYILAPPGATFAILNSNPNPTQIVDYGESYSLTYTDLGNDKNPARVDLNGKYDLVFEIGL